MSRIGNLPVTVPQGVTVDLSEKTVGVRGPKGQLVLFVPVGIVAKKKDDTIIVETKSNDPDARALHGFFRATLGNAVHGVTNGWTKTLELVGVGYRASVSGANLVLTIGFSHPVTIAPPRGVSFATSEGKIVVSGIDRQLIGQVAASVRAVKPPEPYKGKGIKYEGEYIRKKAGKAAKAVGAVVGGAK